jgi:integrase
MTGVIEQNSIKDIVPLRPRNNKIRDCYSLDELAGVFKTKWEDEKSYLLCSLIYSAGLRNSEIRNLRAKDIIHKGGIDFVNIEKSKTQNGIRIIPLHRRLKESLDEWIQNHDLSENDYLFIKRHGQRFDKSAKKAHDFLASRLDRDIPGSEDKSISFYSGRHFYKTMLNNRGLGDIEEMFMGHKVNKNIGDRYNHKNKRGEQELLKKAKKALEIIDECLYR